ncbi:MAG: T9SS type A sorting domain-containing protein [Fimbriimonadaceae bacterium]|nr:T9SS type A sorting domain-containing protein [Chitinophagales bacterium]
MKIRLLLCSAFYCLVISKEMNAQEFTWANAFHGNDAQTVPSVTTDDAGNVYSAINFWNEVDANPNAGVTNFTSAGSQDIAIVKTDVAGNFIWGKKIGGSLFENIRTIVTDSENNFYIIGYFNGTVDFDPSATIHNLVSAGGADAYLAKYDADGNYLWALNICSSGYEESYGVSTDADNNVYLTGYFQNTIDFDPSASTFNLSAIGSNAIFFLKLNASGSFIFAKQIAYAYVNSFITDAEGNMYVTGNFFGTIDFNPGASTYNLTASGFGYDMYVLKLSSDGIFLWADKMSGSNNETGQCIYYDATDNVIYAGAQFEGTVDFNPGAGIENRISAGNFDVCILKLNSDGALLWSRSFGNSNYDAAFGLQLNSNDLFITGNFYGTLDIDPGAGTYEVISNGSSDIFLLTLNTSGDFTGAQSFGGTLEDNAATLHIADNNAMFISGFFEGEVDFDAGDDEFFLDSDFTGWDGFVSRYCLPVIIEDSITICEGDSIFIGGEFQSEAGTYYDYFLTAEGCDSTIITYLEIGDPVLDLGEDIETCDGDTIILDAENEGAIYEWNTDETTQTIAVTEQGNYAVQVFYSSGCVVNDTIFIAFNNIPNVNIGGDLQLCAGDSLLINAGNPGETYLWSTGETTQKIWVNDGGSYSVIVTNSDGCSNYDTIEITLNVLPVVELPDSISACEGDLITVDAGDDGVSYDWNTGPTTQIISITESGNYTVKVTNEFGCLTKDTVNVDINGLPNVDLGPNLDACFGESVNLNAGNASADHLWNTGATTQLITVTETGIYSVVVTNPAGCSEDDEIQIIFHENPDIDLGADLSICADDEITLNAGPGWETYDWSNGATTQAINISSPGNYSVEVTDEFGCSASDTVHVDGITLPNINLGGDLDACEGDILILDAENTGASFDWNTGATTQTITVTESGNYIVEVTYSGGCYASDTIEIEFHDAPNVNLGMDKEICPGESAILNAGNPGSTYEWNTGATTQHLTVTEQANYSVIVTNAFGCTDDDLVFVDVLPAPNVYLGPDIEACEGFIILLDAEEDGSVYSWNTGETTQIISVTESGNYIVEVTNDVGCVDADTIEIHFNEIPDVDLGEDLNICSDDSITLDAEIEGASYEWNTGETTQTITVTTEGTFSVIVTTEFGCIDSDVMHVDEFLSPDVDLGTEIQLCTGGSVTLDAENSGATFLWSTGETTQTIEVTEPGSYSVEVTNIIGCSATGAVDVNITPLPIINLGGDTYICEGGGLVLDAENTGSEFLWSTSQITQTIIVTEAGDYYVLVTDPFGCSNTDTISIAVLPVPIIDIGDDFLLCVGETATLDAGLSGYEYLWNTGETTQTIIISDEGEYSVVISNGFTGCEAFDDITVLNAALPSVEISTNHDDTICLPEDAITLVGDPEGGTFSGTGMSGNIFDPAVAGVGVHTIIYTYTDAIGCSNSDSIVFYVDVCDGISEVNKTQIKIYPNPANDYFIAEFSIEENALLYLHDVNGNILLEEKINKQQNNIPVSNIPTGIYMIQIQSGEVFFNTLLVISR